MKLCNVPNSSWGYSKKLLHLTEGSSYPKGAEQLHAREYGQFNWFGTPGRLPGKSHVERWPRKRVLGLVRREESIQQAQEAGIVHQAYLEPQEAVQEADLIILCTPVLQIPALMEKMLPHLRPGTLVTDVGSVKRELVDHLEPLLTSAGCVYIGSHPMAGSERHGLEHADPNLFSGVPLVSSHPPQPVLMRPSKPSCNSGNLSAVNP